VELLAFTFFPKKPTMRLLLVFLAFVLFTLGVRWFYVCQIRGECGPKLENGTLRLNTLELRADGKTILSGYDHFFFPTNSATPELNDNNRKFLDKTAIVLFDNPRQKLCITGNYGLDEKGADAGFYENLGLQRANAIRQELVRRGVEEKRLYLDYNPGAAAVRQQPIEFNPFDVANTIDYARLAYTFEDMTFSDLNFLPDSAAFKPGLYLVRYADALRQYMAQNPQTKLMIVGHTDNAGEPKGNFELGLKRAQSVMRYLRELGLAPNRMIAVSEGEKHPIAPNETEVGRRRNRRVNFIIE
jgi:outer membrane protein OmpA-like peptidoglycan-associated protein